MRAHAMGLTFARRTWGQVWAVQTPWAELSHQVQLQGAGALAMQGPEDMDARPTLPVYSSPECVPVTRRCHVGDVSAFRWVLCYRSSYRCVCIAHASS